jgi:MFS family permease
MNRPLNSRHVLWFAVTLAMLTYLDRVAFAQAKPEIARELGLSSTQMGLLMSAFGWAYILFEIPGGCLADRQGPRKLLTRIVLWWSFFTAATGWAWSFASMWWMRFLFGAGEAGCFPGISRMLANWTRGEERVRAQSLTWASARWGGALTPILVVGVIHATGSWRRAFVAISVLGALWAWWFWKHFRNHPAGTPATSHQRIPAHMQMPWRRWISNRNVPLLCAQYGFLSIGFWFYTNWLPTYLREGRGWHLDDRTTALLSGAPLLLAGISCLAGGRLLNWLSARWNDPARARRAVALLAFSGAGICILTSLLFQHPLMVVGMLSLALVCNDLTMPGSWSYVMELGGENAGSLAGLMNTAGAIGGTLSPTLVGWLLDASGQKWTLPLMVIAAAYFAGAICWALMKGAVDRPPADTLS